MAVVALSGRVVARRVHGKKLGFYSLLIREQLDAEAHEAIKNYRIKSATDAHDNLTIQVCFLATAFALPEDEWLPFPDSKKSILQGDLLHVQVVETPVESGRKHLTVQRWKLVERLLSDQGTHPHTLHKKALESRQATESVVQKFVIEVPESSEVLVDPLQALDSQRVRLFATVQFGFQDIAAGELIEKLDATDIEVLDGKVIFTMAIDNLAKLHSLRSVEKLYVLVGRFGNLSPSRDRLLSQVGEILPKTVSPALWDHVKHIWTSFHGNDSTLKTFRATIKLSGAVDAVEKQEVAVALASGLQNPIQLTPELTNFDLEFFGHLQFIAGESTGTLLLGASLISKTIAFIDMGKHVGNGVSETGRQLSATTLRPTIAYNLMRTAAVQNGHFVVDPMCGCGTIPELVARQNPGSVFCLAGDFSAVAVERAAFNATLAPSNVLVDVVRWDARRLPLRSHVIDALITDMPFGKRMGTHAKNSRTYPEVLQEFSRVTVKGSGNAVLLTTEKEITQRQIQNNPSWIVHRQNTVSVGGLDAKCFHLTFL